MRSQVTPLHENHLKRKETRRSDGPIKSTRLKPHAPQPIIVNTLDVHQSRVLLLVHLALYVIYKVISVIHLMTTHQVHISTFYMIRSL